MLLPSFQNSQNGSWTEENASFKGRREMIKILNH